MGSGGGVRNLATDTHGLTRIGRGKMVLRGSEFWGNRQLLEQELAEETDSGEAMGSEERVLFFLCRLGYLLPLVLIAVKPHRELCGDARNFIMWPFVPGALGLRPSEL